MIVADAVAANLAKASWIRRMFEEGARFFHGIGCRAGCFVGNIALETDEVVDVDSQRVGDLGQHRKTGKRLATFQTAEV